MAINCRSLRVAASLACSLHHIFNISEVIGALRIGGLPNNLFATSETMVGKLWPVGSGEPHILCTHLMLYSAACIALRDLVVPVRKVRYKPTCNEFAGSAGTSYHFAHDCHRL